MASSRPVLCGSIAGRPGRFGVAMHTAAFRALGLDFVYVAFGTEDSAGAMAAMRALGIRGLGVTTPHKRAVIEYLDSVDETARAIGAVNTVVNEDGRLSGHNVDWIGAVRAFERVRPLAGLRAAVVGAGGGARAIVYGLVRCGVQVHVFNRTDASGRALCREIGGVFAGPPAAMADAAPFDLIAHVTTVGFHDPAAGVVPEAALHPGTMVFDAVPLPIRTQLLRVAEARGCLTIPGVRMQLEQAACQFELYTGVVPELGVMEQALMAAIAQDEAGGGTAR
jgi:shikimate dehydrogenase